MDQCEELLTQSGRANRARFAQLLRPALSGRVQVVATLRAEFVDQLLTDSDLTVVPTHTYELRPLRREALREVIKSPRRLHIRNRGRVPRIRHLKGLHHVPTANPGKPCQGSATSSSTMLGSGPLRGSGIPSGPLPSELRSCDERAPARLLGALPRGYRPVGRSRWHSADENGLSVASSPVVLREVTTGQDA